MAEEEKVKKKRTKKKDKESKVYKKYVDPSPISKSFEKLPLPRLKPNMINTGWLTGVYIATEGDEVIQLNNSWVELCMILLGTIHANNREDFLKILVKHKVIGDGFDVTTADISFFDDEQKTKVINIKGTEFKIITSMDPRIISKTLMRIIAALELKKEQIKFNIVPIGDAPTTVKLKEGTTSIKTKQITVDEAFKTVNSASKISEISILGSEGTVKTFYGAVEKLLDWALVMYGEEKLLKGMVCNTQSIGITDVEAINCANVNKIDDTKLFMYSNGEDSTYVEFIYKLCLFYNIAPSLVLMRITQMYFEEN